MQIFYQQFIKINIGNRYEIKAISSNTNSYYKIVQRRFCNIEWLMPIILENSPIRLDYIESAIGINSIKNFD